ncbi:Ulp1-like peptidase [Cucumis melo var. makuwa]|uniref:Ulp1-like peptidase n=1 Tax=Cucumis melo var. makuwa TaxID=1194695 RepID=A0A5A7TWK9_CUCMM|nr:Ulp1-like peptidase [Cucumis melo var. makuwa]
MTVEGSSSTAWRVVQLCFHTVVKPKLKLSTQEKAFMESRIQGDDNMKMEDDESIRHINNNDTKTLGHAMNNKSLEQSDSSPQLSPQGEQSQISSGSVERTHQSRDPEGCTYQFSDPERYTYQSSDPEGCTYQSSAPEGCTYQSSASEGCTYQSSDPEGCTYRSSDPEGYTYPLDPRSSSGKTLTWFTVGCSVNDAAKGGWTSADAIGQRTHGGVRLRETEREVGKRRDRGRRTLKLKKLPTMEMEVETETRRRRRDEVGRRYSSSEERRGRRMDDTIRKQSLELSEMKQMLERLVQNDNDDQNREDMISSDQEYVEEHHTEEQHTKQQHTEHQEETQREHQQESGSDISIDDRDADLLMTIKDVSNNLNAKTVGDFKEKPGWGDVNYVIACINIKEHWLAIAADMRKCKIYVFDSIPNYVEQKLVDQALQMPARCIASLAITIGVNHHSERFT